MTRHLHSPPISGYDTDASENRPAPATPSNKPANHFLSSPTPGGDERVDDPQSHVRPISPHSPDSKKTFRGSSPYVQALFMWLQRLMCTTHRSTSPLENSAGDDKALGSFRVPPHSRVMVNPNEHRSTLAPPVRIACVLERRLLLMTP